MALGGEKKRPKAVLLFIIILGIFLGLMIYGSFGDRFWEAFVASGDRAFRLGDYERAEKMYRQALRYSLELSPDDERAAKSLLLLHRLYKTQGRDELAERALAEAREIRAGSGD